MPTVEVSTRAFRGGRQVSDGQGKPSLRTMMRQVCDDLAASNTRLAELQAKLDDAIARQTENLTAETLLSAAGPIAAQVKQGLNVPRTEQIDIFAADFVTQNLSAYESYVAGLGFFLNYQYKQAEQDQR